MQAQLKTVVKGLYRGVPYLIRQWSFPKRLGLANSHTAYIGLPLNSPLAAIPIEDFALHTHGGLSYGKADDIEAGFFDGFFWFGWDYAHACCGKYAGPWACAYNKAGEGDPQARLEIVRQDVWRAIDETLLLLYKTGAI